MSSGNRDAAMEQQAPVRSIDHGVAGRSRTKTSGFSTIGVLLHSNTGNGGCLAQKRSVCPRRVHAGRLEEENMSANTALRARQKHFQLIDASPGAGAMGMGKHDQSRVGSCKRNRAAGGPMCRHTFM